MQSVDPNTGYVYPHSQVSIDLQGRGSQDLQLNSPFTVNR